MKFRFGCRGCPACNMNRKHQHCNFKKLIFFPQERRKIKSLDLLVRPPPPCLLTLNNGWALSVLLNTVWNSRPHTEHIWKQNMQQEMDGTTCSIYISVALLAYTHIWYTGMREWLAVGPDLYLPSVLSILWDQLYHRNTGRGLLQCMTAGMGLYVHCRFIVLLDQDLYSHTPLLLKSLIGAWTFIYLQGWVLHKAPGGRDRTLHVSARAGSTFKEIWF